MTNIISLGQDRTSGEYGIIVLLMLAWSTLNTSLINTLLQMIVFQFIVLSLVLLTHSKPPDRLLGVQ